MKNTPKVTEVLRERIIDQPGRCGRKPHAVSLPLPFKHSLIVLQFYVYGTVIW